MSVEQMFIFEEMTVVPHFLTKPRPAAFCAWREVTARFYTEVLAKGQPSAGRVVQLKAGEMSKCLRREESSDQLGGPGGPVRAPCRTLARHWAIVGVFVLMSHKIVVS